MALKNYEVTIFALDRNKAYPVLAKLTVLQHNSRLAAKGALGDYWGAQEVFILSKTKGLQAFTLGEGGKLVELPDGEAKLNKRKLQVAMTYLQKRTPEPEKKNFDDLTVMAAADMRLTEAAPGATFELSYELTDEPKVVRSYRWRSRGFTRYEVAQRKVMARGGWAKLEMVWIDDAGNEKRVVVIDTNGNNCQVAA